MGFFYLYKRPNYERNILLHRRRIKNKRRIRLFKSVMRPKASADIAEARDKGDLSENAEYDAAKEARNARNAN
jgi:transcription elongation GreA/GreB family factor